MCLEFQALRLVLAIDVDRKLQQRLWGLPGAFVLRLGSHTGVVTIVTIDHELMQGDIVRRTIAFFERIEAKTENCQQTIHKRDRRELVLGGAVLQYFRVECEWSCDKVAHRVDER